MEMMELAEQIGKKLWNKATDHGLGIRAISARQIKNFSEDERMLIFSGWISFAYCNYECDSKTNQFGKLWIVKK